MTNLPPCFTHLLAAWNEKDTRLIRGHLEKAVAPDVVFCDPNYLVEGIDEFEAMVTEFVETYPTATCAHTSGLDSHHDRFRYLWLVSVGDTPMVAGMDVVFTNAEGLIARLDGFFGPFPERGAI